MPATTPATATKPELAVPGNGAWVISARAPTTTKPLPCTMAVNRNAFTRRAPTPPRKSLAPQTPTAVKL